MGLSHFSVYCLLLLAASFYCTAHAAADPSEFEGHFLHQTASGCRHGRLCLERVAPTGTYPDHAWQCAVQLLHALVPAFVPKADGLAATFAKAQPAAPSIGNSQLHSSRKLLRTVVVDRSKIVVKVKDDKVTVKSTGDNVDYVAQTGEGKARSVSVSVTRMKTNKRTGEVKVVTKSRSKTRSSGTVGAGTYAASSVAGGSPGSEVELGSYATSAVFGTGESESSSQATAVLQPGA